MWKIENGNILLTRGDTLRIPIVISDYELQEGDIIEMTCRESDEENAKILFNILADSNGVINILPGHTKDLAFNGEYVYDIQATLNNGADVVTYGIKRFRILKEATY